MKDIYEFLSLAALNYIKKLLLLFVFNYLRDKEFSPKTVNDSSNLFLQPNSDWKIRCPLFFPIHVAEEHREQ